MTENLQLPLPAERLIPHRLPMRLIDTLMKAGAGAATAAATVAADGPLTGADGRLEEIGLVEMMAQTFAALQGYEDARRGQPMKRGFLVGVRWLKLQERAQAGDRLEVRVRTVAEMAGFALAEGEVCRDGEILATGSFKLWVSPEPAEAA